MLKSMHLHQLKEGEDPEEVWKYWAEVHAARVVNRPGLKKYCISRINDPNQVMGKGAEECQWWGMAEIWWDFDSVDEFLKATEEFNAVSENGEELANFFNKWSWFSGYIVEEKVIVDRLVDGE